MEYSDKSKLTFTDIQKFATVEESAERKTVRNKSATMNSINKGGKARAKASTQKPPAASMESEKKKMR